MAQVDGKADHMFIGADDGREQYIARGGPDFQTSAQAGATLARGGPIVTGRVDPARQSPDARTATRVLSRGFVPQRSAQEVMEPARRHAAAMPAARNLYGWTINSNSFAADVYDDIFGCRVGDDRTWGSGSRLREEAPPEMLRRAIVGPRF